MTNRPARGDFSPPADSSKVNVSAGFSLSSTGELAATCMNEARTGSNCGTELTQPNLALFLARWDGIKAAVTDLRILAAMWDAPKERAARQAIRDLLSRPNPEVQP